MEATTKGISGLVPTRIGPVPIDKASSQSHAWRNAKRWSPILNDVTQFSDYWEVPHVPDWSRLLRLYSSKYSC